MMWDEEHATPWARAFHVARLLEALDTWGESPPSELRSKCRKTVEWAARDLWRDAWTLARDEVKRA
jgi:hypothetical protein